MARVQEEIHPLPAAVEGLDVVEIRKTREGKKREEKRQGVRLGVDPEGTTERTNHMGKVGWIVKKNRLQDKNNRSKSSVCAICQQIIVRDNAVHGISVKTAPSSLGGAFGTIPIKMGRFFC